VARYPGARTRGGYEADFRLFEVWCGDNGLAGMPAEPSTVATYVAIEAQRGIRPSTLERRLAAIRHVHIDAGHQSPADNRHVRDVMAGIRNEKGTALDSKAPATADRLTAMLACISADTLTGKRDRALLAIGFAAALRRSELVALVVGDLEEVPEGIRLTVRRSKTDQQGAGYMIAIPAGIKLRPLVTVRAWLDAAGITSGRAVPLDQQGRTRVRRGFEWPDGRQPREAVRCGCRFRCHGIQRAQRAGFVTTPRPRPPRSGRCKPSRGTRRRTSYRATSATPRRSRTMPAGCFCEAGWSHVRPKCAAVTPAGAWPQFYAVSLQGDE
jgi:integrase